MRNTVLGITLILLSIGTGSCGLWGGEEPETEQSSPPTADDPSFPSASPEIPSSSVAKVILTKPTSPDERLRVVKSGRNDPFGAIVPTFEPDNTQPSSTQSTSPAPARSVPASQVKMPKASTSPKVGKSASSSPTQKIELPELPKPEVAQGVKVTGVVNLGGQPKAILKAPGEKSMRTVRVGERIANGQVLVKSISLRNPAAPVIVLEQAGMEVRIGVGQEPIALASTADQDKAKK